MVNKKIILILSACVLAICVGAIVLNMNSKEEVENIVPEENGYQTSTYITEDVKANTQTVTSMLCLVSEYTPQKLLDDADAVVIASVISVDSCTANEGLFGMTRGKIVINNSLAGTLKNQEVVTYAKNGGIMPYAEWEKTQPDAANAKRAYLREKEGVKLDVENTYIQLKPDTDIDIEEGRTYLMYLRKYEDSYEIIGLNVGLREVNVPKADVVTPNSMDTKSLQIKNNETGEFESLENYINTYINIK